MLIRPFVRPFLIASAALLFALPAAAQTSPTPTPEPLPNCPAFASQPDAERLAYYMGEGYAFRSAGRLGDAQLSFTCVIRLLDADYLPAYMARGEVFLQTRQLERAVQDYTRAGQLDGSLPQSFNNRGVAFALAFDFERARDDFEQAISIDAAHMPALNNLAIMLAMNGDYEDAIMLIENAITASDVDEQLADLTNPTRPADAPALAIDRDEARLYSLMGTLRSLQALASYQDYVFLSNYGGFGIDERISAAASNLESRFTFDFRLDDGSLLQISSFAGSGR